jgi:hypothetical protein
VHDIGKSQAKLNVFEKSIIVPINCITFGNFLKYNRNKGIAKYYNHPKIGGKLLDGIKEVYLDIIDYVIIVISNRRKV